MIINNPFNGKLNLDDALYRISNGDFIDALNITRDSPGLLSDKVVANIVGNTEIQYTLPSGTNKVIGFFADKIKNRGYYFVWNSSGFHSILYYDANTDSVNKVLISKTDSAGIDILNFNPTYKVTSINIYYKDSGDLLFFNDAYNPPRYINVQTVNSLLPYKEEYMSVIKAPPTTPPLVVYENDDTVKTNNLRNKLFQFSYRYVYLDNEKSVWSSKSIVPLPQQPTINLTENSVSLNSRIAIFYPTNNQYLKGVEICFRETSAGITSNWYLISSVDNKNPDSINRFLFYNDGVYVALDAAETLQLQDYVPLKANASELANGNTLLYAGLLEGYNKTNVDLRVTTQNNIENYFADYCGTLFFAAVNQYTYYDGISNPISRYLDIYLYGTGSNVNGNVSTLNNAAATYVINITNTYGIDVGLNYINANSNANVSVLLNAFRTQLVSKGWSFVNISGNKLRVSYPTNFRLFSSGLRFKSYGDPVSPDNTELASAWQCGYQFALQYFDKYGRTIGAQTSVDTSTINTPADNWLVSNNSKYSQIYVSIYNRPPKEAAYYQILRSNNTTYNKMLYWISEGAYTNVPIYSPGVTTSTTTTTISPSGFINTDFVYIDITNIEAYNKLISSTDNVVSYSFSPGDRIRFISRFDVNNVQYTVPTADFEILGVETTIQYYSATGNKTTKVGNFIKIYYPSGIVNNGSDYSNGSFKFNANENFLHYKIFIYNLSSLSDSSNSLFYEFGKCFGIGNAGTDLAYHFGLDQTQSAPNPALTPAIISVNNGDLFYRKRSLIYSNSYNFDAGNISLSGSSISGFVFPIEAYVLTNAYFIQNGCSANIGDLACGTDLTGVTYSDDYQFIYNNSSTQSLSLTFTGDIGVTSTGMDGFANLTLQYIVPSDPNGLRSIIIGTVQVTDGVKVILSFNTNAILPPLAKAYLTFGYTGPDECFMSSFSLGVSVNYSQTIKIIESSFNDTYNLITNSNGRSSVIDNNISQRFFPTLIRFGQSFNINTNDNGLNRFYYENFDEYDSTFGPVMRLHVRDRYLKVYQKFKVGNVPILTQIVKDSANNPLQANTDTLINKIQYYAGDYGIGDAVASLAWNNFSDYFVDNIRGVVCRLSQDGITPISILYKMNAFFVPILNSYNSNLNENVVLSNQGAPSIYGVFDAYTNKYIIALEEINRYQLITTTSTTTLPPVRINWSNTDYNSGGIYIDSDLYINGVLVGGGVDATGYVYVPANSTVIFAQNSSTSSNRIGKYDLVLDNTTTSTTIYNDTKYAVVNSYISLHGSSFVALAGNVYELTAYATFFSNTTTTTTTASPTTSTTTTTTNGPTTLNISYYVGDQPGGQLVILDKNNNELANVSSTGGGAQIGSISPSITLAPFTIRGAWASVPGNIIRFNVCDLISGTELYTSPNITSTNTPVDYTPNPTPISMQVNLTANDTALPSCNL